MGIGGRVGAAGVSSAGRRRRAWQPTPIIAGRADAARPKVPQAVHELRGRGPGLGTSGLFESRIACDDDGRSSSEMSFRGSADRESRDGGVLRPSDGRTVVGLHAQTFHRSTIRCLGASNDRAGSSALLLTFPVRVLGIDPGRMRAGTSWRGSGRAHQSSNTLWQTSAGSARSLDKDDLRRVQEPVADTRRPPSRWKSRSSGADARSRSSSGRHAGVWSRPR